MHKPELDRAEVWFFCELEDYGQPLRHLVNANKDHRSSFALHVGPLEDASKSVGLGLHGWGRDGQTQWMAHDGMFWPGTHENQVATLRSGKDGYWAVVAERGRFDNQTWRFEETQLSGEAVPSYRKGMYATREGRDTSKWYAEH
ncbi:hypothetical protein PV755_45890 [Streptomyces caniscabiei]|uniref:Uncharacterized protein n=1 Tax=Streptomyces caniscabiei TaxID=2746961 RepID=A0A927LD08_9ACTN|nr:hypothetical protein [Streptomyces caniscabiei]MBD9730147.1 hypothetical protein [Streptomyces caniscabiei]MDX3516148.1 hypothetical protein [Streptomyces caniscabiei]MDX3725226.1 hypothetical protein [Streptomyces caniscabiei]WEO21703.1 hypothetical protein IHE65_00275 [Streptomyces caniscabiei]